jgi:hypothetical protein
MAFKEGTKGTSDTAFSPDADVTRGQMVTFLWRLAGQPSASAPCTFSDVDQSRYFADAIAWASENSITTGYAGTDKFGPEDKCTREQIVTFLYRYAGKPAPADSASATAAHVLCVSPSCIAMLNSKIESDSV